MDSELRDDLLEDEFEDIEANEEADDMLVEFDPFADLSDEELDAMVEAAGDAGAAYGLVAGDTPEGFRSGFVALVGRPNAGKSTLLNACVGTKVAITSPVAQTTRRRMRAVVNRDDFQLVFVDTPGIHKPKDGLGSELNRSALVGARGPRRRVGGRARACLACDEDLGAHEGRQGRPGQDDAANRGGPRARGLR